ncbi:hypothetical protein PIROE2DRAFT_17180 [Piromyces sp. E2]|nr:hypothetical protein PIROE2DRAFT_17180 [Piromyces sp. E2]|eukprot:OUM57736.1 hypothetical protein PIROE2DRAFT_17180 [Piromyces sp. E2]
MKFLNIILASIALISTASTSECNWNNNKYGKIDKEATIYGEKIWNFFVKKIGNENGAAALIGNLYAKSNLKPNNLEDFFERVLGVDDEQYTKNVDNGSYKNFVTDEAGYGLAQWIYHSKKDKLLKFAQNQGKSIGDVDMQLEFLWKEINENYKDVVRVLKDKNVSIKEASDIFVNKYEKPVSKSQNMLRNRSNYGNMFKDACGSQ